MSLYAQLTPIIEADQRMSKQCDMAFDDDQALLTVVMEGNLELVKTLTDASASCQLNGLQWAAEDLLLAADHLSAYLTLSSIFR